MPMPSSRNLCAGSGVACPGCHPSGAALRSPLYACSSGFWRWSLSGVGPPRRSFASSSMSSHLSCGGGHRTAHASHQGTAGPLRLEAPGPLKRTVLTESGSGSRPSSPSVGPVWYPFQCQCQCQYPYEAGLAPPAPPGRTDGRADKSKGQVVLATAIEICV